MGFESYRYYHPGIDRESSLRLLRQCKAGAFLVRPSSRRGCLSISVRTESRIAHFLIFVVDDKEGEKYQVDPKAWPGHEIKNHSYTTLHKLIKALSTVEKMTQTFNSGIPRGGDKEEAEPPKELYEDEDFEILKGAKPNENAAGAGAVAEHGQHLGAQNNVYAQDPGVPNMPQLRRMQTAHDHGVVMMGSQVERAIKEHEMKGPAKPLPPSKAQIAQQQRSILLEQYKGMLNMCIQDGSVSSSELQHLSAWREKHGFTSQMHAEVLSTIGLTEAAFDKMKNFSRAPDRDSTCVICLDAPRNCVLVNCGHLQTCMECSEHLKNKECPMCRAPVTATMRVFT